MPFHAAGKNLRAFQNIKFFNFLKHSVKSGIAYRKLASG